MLQVIFLGTAGSLPTVKRGAPCVVVLRRGELLLFDCGEGTQRQMSVTGMGLKAKLRIFVSHMHGDHVLGIPGLLQTMALFDRTATLRIYGPEGICAYVKALKETVKFGLTYPIEVMEIGEGLVFEERDYRVESAWMKHPVPALGYAIVERDRPGKFSPSKAEALGIPEGPLRGELQKGKTVLNSEGRPVRPNDVMGCPRKGRKIAYTGDTSPCEATITLARGADLLIHEATFGDELVEKAIESGHSTPWEAAKIALEADAKRLVLTHISGRYIEERGFLDRARLTFPETTVAEDFLVVKVPLPE